MSFASILFVLALQAEAPAAAATAAPTAPPEAKAVEKPAPAPMPSGTIVVLHTSMGDIKLELDRDKAPVSVDNFLKYARKKHYDGTIFHRVMRGFMIQGGGMNVSMMDKPTDPPIKNESGNGLSNVRGSVAMARTSELNSATSQFFINHVDNTRLDGARYAVFGKVIEGMDVVDKIATVTVTTKGMHENVPREPITIETVEIVSDPKAPAAKAAKPAAPAKASKPRPKADEAAPKK